MAQADRRREAAAESGIWDQISEVENLQDFEIPGVSKIQQMEEQMAHMQMENKNMSDWMTTLEMGMQALIQHLRGMRV